MTRIIWSCWFQGREAAPTVVRRCLASWERRNPTWELRCLDATSMRRYVDLEAVSGKEITAASLSDLLRIRLLSEYGGVWVDATLFCNRPLDEWLGSVCHRGFFAFARPEPDRLLSSWFLAAQEHNRLVGRWCDASVVYWSGRARSSEYFWFHRLFDELCETDPTFAREWHEVPKISADGPHAIQRVGMFAQKAATEGRIDWHAPVFKLTYRYDPSEYEPGTLLWHLLEHEEARDLPHRSRGPGARAGVTTSARSRLTAAWSRVERPVAGRAGPRGRLVLSNAASRISSRVAAILPTGLLPLWWRWQRPRTVASLKVSTQNLGDHVQVLAGQRLLRRWGVTPTAFVDRDDELGSSDALARLPGPVALLVNGWFKNRGHQWPPSDKFLPIFLGFHIRLFQCPELVSERSLAYYRRHGPVGCRDTYTRNLLAAAGVDCFESNCLAVALPRRRDDDETQTELFVASRDRRLLEVVPGFLGPRTYVSHYSETRDFESNLARAEALLETYRSRARMIVTTFLHCALPAIAMGIPVVVFYPENDEHGRASDVERFSSLSRLVRVYRFDQIDEVDWSPRPVEVATLKIALVDQLQGLIGRWQLADDTPFGPIAPQSALPAPSQAGRRESPSEGSSPVGPTPCPR